VSVLRPLRQFASQISSPRRVDRKSKSNNQHSSYYGGALQLPKDGSAARRGFATAQRQLCGSPKPTNQNCSHPPPPPPPKQAFGVTEGTATRRMPSAPNTMLAQATLSTGTVQPASHSESAGGAFTAVNTHDLEFSDFSSPVESSLTIRLPSSPPCAKPSICVSNASKLLLT